MSASLISELLRRLEDDLEASVHEHVRAWANSKGDPETGLLVQVLDLHVAFSLNVYSERSLGEAAVDGTPSDSASAQAAELVMLHARNGAFDDANDPSGIQRLVLTIIGEHGGQSTPKAVRASLTDRGLDRHPKSVQSVLRRMTLRGALVRIGHGRYGLAYPPLPTDAGAKEDPMA